MQLLTFLYVEGFELSFDLVELTDDQRDRLLAMPEGHFVEKKDVRISPSKMSRTVSAFANSDGGELYVGFTPVGNRFSWDGYVNQEAANAHVQVLDGLFPLGYDYVCDFLSHADETGIILHITVRKTRAVIVATDRLPYVRKSAQNLPLDTPEKRHRLERNKGITSFEAETISVSPSVVTESDTIARFMKEVIPSSTPLEWLRKQQLIQQDRPTVAGILLFADVPQAILPKRSGIKVYRYKTNAARGTRDTLAATPESIDGCAYSLIKEAVAKTQDIIVASHVLTSGGFERIEYPTEALHEVITNAVIHRDYEIADDVHVRIFDNRVEVESPGLLAGHVTVANILSESFHRNGAFARMLNKFPDPPNKDVGEGLRTAFDAMRKHRLRDPIIRQTESSVIVEIRHERLASPEEIVMEYLETNASITNRKARELCGIPSENSMKSVFNRLKDRQKIERVPGLSGGMSAWRKVVTPVVEEVRVDGPQRNMQRTLFDDSP